MFSTVMLLCMLNQCPIYTSHPRFHRQLAAHGCDIVQLMARSRDRLEAEVLALPSEAKENSCRVYTSWA